MPLPIWIPDALHSEQLSVDQTYWAGPYTKDLNF